MAKKVTGAKKSTKKAVTIPYKDKPTATLVSFSVMAVIPTQQYGNIQPKIEVTAKTIEDARAVVMPMIEDLYKTYAEMPLNGKEPKFYGKITETVKVVDTESVAQEQAATTRQPDALNAAAIKSQQEQAAPAPTPAAEKPEPVLKAEKAIALAATEDATHAIQDQIQNSTKILPEYKPALYELVLKRRKELSKQL